MKTLYYAEGVSWPFDNEKDALSAEAKHKEDCARWIDNSPQSKMEKLIKDLENATYILPGTIATCPYTSIQIKGMVKVCQKFTEENKEYLSSY